MSSLSAAQADGYYIPPAYLESGKFKKKSLNQFAGSKGHNQYLQRSVVRFELPYDGFCLGCEAHVGKGTRFNAHKSHCDDYFSTKIWEFTMKCRACANATFKIRTDPRERGFAYVSGIKRKVEEFDTAAAGTAGVIDTELGNGIIEGSGPADGKDMNTPLAKLEKSVVGERKAMTERDQMEALLKINDGSMWDDAASNASLRSTYRSARQTKKRRLGAGAARGLGKGIELPDSTDEDVSAARNAFITSLPDKKKACKMEKDALMRLRSGSIFRKDSQGISTPGMQKKPPALTKRSGVSTAGSEWRGQKPVERKNEHVSKKHCFVDNGSHMASYSSETKSDGSTDNIENKCRNEPASSAALAALSGYGSDSD
uniref:Splicing factor YJU2 n=1 Tax=Odontella aurita TaxID=265563 RepID=A0A7S4JXD7_9STRA|mmetsp:Transcript_56491/g.169007  ORF Transcript_56491/g.169007 Transcript_56491/m.169007 type:complete len:371 (+) Transcript_56491:41-1153(+)